ncbi:MAG: dihydroorotate dehydrogenase electron transfer subunit [Treponema sp.]|nr:dihydroorotate dehydrogenase electron transfer subunit [Treponema sp.]
MTASIVCDLVSNTSINGDFFILQYRWEGEAPRAGQYFMLKPLRSCVFLPRPISVFGFDNEAKMLRFLIFKRGKGTEELYNLVQGEKTLLTGPLGNAWADFLPESGRAALVGGSAGVAPLAALAAEKPDFYFEFFAGFKNGFFDKGQENAVLGSALKTKNIVVAAEDGRNAQYGQILDFIKNPEFYDVIFACGSIPMLAALKRKCQPKKVPCFISMETVFACGVGACLGCTVQTVNGNRRCCKDGPIFDSQEIIFNDA